MPNDGYGVYKRAMETGYLGGQKRGKQKRHRFDMTDFAKKKKKAKKAPGSSFNELGRSVSGSRLSPVAL